MKLRSRGFTLIELLVVIAIIAILVAMLLPAVQQVREAARKSQCQDHLHNYGVALHSYDNDFKMLPIGGTYVRWGQTQPNVSWHARILPYMEQKPLYDKINFEVMQNGGGWDSFARPGVRVRQVELDYALCPSDSSGRLSTVWAQTNYSGNLGSQYIPSDSGSCQIFTTPGFHYENPGGHVMHGNSQNKRHISGMFSRLGASIALRDMSDGTSNAFMIGEILPACVGHRRGMWHMDGSGCAHAGTQVPINTWTTCEKPYLKANPEYPQCSPSAYGNNASISHRNWNLSWGFRSAHPGGAQFCMGDGKVTFFSENIDYQTYQRLGGRRDGRPVRVP